MCSVAAELLGVNRRTDVTQTTVAFLKTFGKALKTMQGHAETTRCVNATGLPVHKRIVSRYRRGISVIKL
jgi:hypothetical protein